MQATMKATIFQAKQRVHHLAPIFSFAFILLLAGCALPTTPPAPAAPQPSAPASLGQTIVVVGNGNTRVQANIAQINLGIEAVDDTVLAANRIASEIMERVLETLASQSIASRDIKPYAYYIYAERYYPDYERDDPGTVPLFPEANEEIRYRVIHHIHVLIRDFDKVPTVVAAIVEAGGPGIYIYGTDLLYDDPESLEPAATELAISDARGKAEEIAALLGVELGSVIGVSEYMQGSGLTWDTFQIPSLWAGQLIFYKQLQVTYLTIPTEAASVLATPTLTTTAPLTEGVTITDSQ